jgi:CBS domain-containing protein
MQRRFVHLPIYTRETIAPNGARTRQRLVFCPPRQRTIDPSSCDECIHANAVSAIGVECSPPAPCVERHQDPSTVAVGAIASSTFACLDGELTAEAISPLLAQQPGGLPVVDERGRFCGFASHAIPGKSGLPPRLTSTMRVKDLAIGHALAIGEGCSLHDAVEALALRHARALAVVDSDGTVQGLLTDIEALRTWAALRRDR